MQTSAFGVVHISKGMPLNPKNTIAAPVMARHLKRISSKMAKEKLAKK